MGIHQAIRGVHQDDLDIASTAHAAFSLPFRPFTKNACERHTFFTFILLNFSVSIYHQHFRPGNGSDAILVGYKLYITCKYISIYREVAAAWDHK
jgi:hypothetical protein